MRQALKVQFLLLIIKVMRKTRKSQSKVVKRIIKFIFLAPDSEVVRSVLLRASDGVIRAISNAALNAREGDVCNLQRLKQLFSKYHRHISYLTDRRLPLANKRHLLVQRGGFLTIIAPLIATDL